MKKISIYEPELIGNEKKYLMDCIDTNWISSQGSYIKKFENKIAEYHDSKHCIATSNCTTALHLDLKSLNIGFEDEVNLIQQSHHHHVEGLQESCKLCETECTGACEDSESNEYTDTSKEGLNKSFQNENHHLLILLRYVE